jgi:excisionase family DNA binding protein
MTEALPNDLISPEEAACLAEVSLPTLYRAMKGGELRQYRIAPGTKATFYSRAVVRRWRDARRAARRK